ncbi:bidirectional sugar transporter SWEET6b-like [Trifolium pratense]|uniref:bidirectional sugar transporter SWEET6b-like n=1 Tax=Trifolium pratense TaxID=57577 RepID=UPI001E696638|nr:bidirectional sugar transporter SWEET6b-like [Trifolium pratense]
MTSASLINTVGAIGNVISFVLFFSPAPTFYKIIKKKDVEEFKPDPYLVTLLNCAIWVFYGMPYVQPHGIYFVIVDGSGFVFQFVYLTIFYVYANNKGKKKFLLYLLIEIIFFAAIVLITMLALHDNTKRSSVVGILGILCAIFNALMYVSPLTIMTKVVKTNSVKYMPFCLSLAIFLDGLVWTINALITPFALTHPFGIYVMISTSIGAISGLVQLILYAYYWCMGENNVDDDAELVLNPVVVAV